MAHKTLINGTAYEISGGTTRVSGTSYKINNGKALIGGTAYDISFMLPPDVVNVWSGEYQSYVYLNCIAYGNGYWVVGGYNHTDSGYVAQIAYSRSLDGPWTLKTLWTSTVAKSGNTINAITYSNGYWVATGLCRNNSGSSARIAYATSPGGTWTTKDIWSNSATRATFNSIGTIYFDSSSKYWVVGGCYDTGSNNYARIAYTTSLNGTWTTKDLWNNNYGASVNCIIHANNYWVLGGQNRGSSKGATLAYCTTLSGTWTIKYMWGEKSQRSDSIKSIAYNGNYWVVGGCYTHVDSSGSYGMIAYATSPGASWTTKTLWGETTGGSSSYEINSLAYGDGYWVAVGKNDDISYMAYATSPGANWTTKEVFNDTRHDDVMTCVANINGYWVATGRNYDTSGYYASLAYAESPAELGTTQ